VARTYPVKLIDAMLIWIRDEARREVNNAKEAEHWQVEAGWFLWTTADIIDQQRVAVIISGGCCLTVRISPRSHWTPRLPPRCPGALGQGPQLDLRPGVHCRARARPGGTTVTRLDLWIARAFLCPVGNGPEAPPTWITFQDLFLFC